jgi:hypothetical protein
MKYTLYISALIFCISSLLATDRKNHIAYTVSIRDKLSIVDSINKYRNELGLEPLAYDVDMEKLPITRTSSIYAHLKSLESLESDEFKKNISKHLHFQFHYDQLSFHIKLVRSKSKYTMPFAMENVAFLVGHADNVHLIMFEGWKNSPGHWNAMMSSSVNFITMNFASTDIGNIGDMILFSKFMKKRNTIVHSENKR